MKIFDATIGQEVVRAKGDNTGIIGIVQKLDFVANKVEVKWEKGFSTTKVNPTQLEPTSIPYEIIPFKEWRNQKGEYKFSKPKYVRK